jgi:hypothetical protein
MTAPRTQIGVIAAVVLAQLAFVQLALRGLGRATALAGFVAGMWFVTASWPHESGRAVRWPWTPWLSSAGVAAMSGLFLMSMLLGHAYLTASKMSMRPFRRLGACLAGITIARAICAVGLTMFLQWHRPVAGLWPVHGFLIVTRWAVGLLLPFVFALMARDCIRRRATQSATGILYVAGVLVFIGELIGLNLARETGLPF